jgi:hypothetical protein
MTTPRQYDDLFYIRDNQIDLIFLIDASTSMNDKIKVPTETGVKMFKKIDVINDSIKKITTLHDCEVMPGTENYGFSSVSTPAINHTEKMPPWGTNPDGSSMTQAELESMPIGYLRRFSVKIESQKLNIGVVKISSKEDSEVMSSILNYPDCFDRHYLYEKIKNGFGTTREKDYLHSTRMALYEMFFGPRSKQVLKRFLFYIGDGFTPRNKDAVELCNLLKPNNLLSMRRPLDIELKGNQLLSEDRKPVRYNGANKSLWFGQPVKTAAFFMGVGSRSRGVSKKCKEYAFDFEQRPMNPMGFFDVVNDSSAGQFNRILGLVNIVDRISYDNGFENVFSITLHNCGPHEVTLLNTIVNFENDSDDTPEDERSIPYVGSTKYTTEFLKSGIPKGNDLYNIETLTANEDGSFDYGKVKAGEESGAELLVDRDNIQDIGLAFEATVNDDPDDIIGARNNALLAGRGGQFYGDQENADLYEDINSNYNILWQSFNTKYEVYRRGKIFNIDGGWASQWKESKGVKNDGVAFKGMPVRVFKSESTGFEIIDYNIGNAVEENGYMGDYSHLPRIERGGEIDLFFGVRVGESLDASQDLISYDALLEKVQLFVNSEDKTMNKMGCFANVDFNLICPIFRPSKEVFKQGYDLFVPFDTELSLPPVDDDGGDEVDMPMGGTWEIEFNDPAYIHNTAKITINIPDKAEAAPTYNNKGEIDGSDPTKAITSVVASMNFDLKDFDCSGFVSGLTNTIVDPGSGITGTLTPSSLAAKNAYAAPVGAPGTTTSYSSATVFFNINTKEFYLILGPRTAASGAEPPPPGFTVNGRSLSYSAQHPTAGNQTLGVVDATYTCLQFNFNIDPDLEDTSVGEGNDFKSALKNSHGAWYSMNTTWADLVDATKGPTPDDPGKGTNWIGINSKPVTISRV